MSKRLNVSQTFIIRPVSPLRILWKSRLALGILALGVLLALHYAQAAQPPYITIGLIGFALGIFVWRGRDAVSMLRAAKWGEVRQARVQRFDRTSITSNGVSLVRMVWQDALGHSGKSKAALPDHFPAIGTKIVVYCDPKSGKSWWEDAL